jgi:hypothetical protein
MYRFMRGFRNAKFGLYLLGIDAFLMAILHRHVQPMQETRGSPLFGPSPNGLTADAA